MTFKTTRRHFMKSTATAGAGIIIVKDLLANESPNEKIAFASVGLGGMGLHDSGEAANNGEVVAVCDTNRNQLRGVKERFVNAKPFEDYRVMFDEMGDKIDAFTVSTADHMHGIISAHGMMLGKHCLTQKPLTRTVYEARRLGEIAREKKVVTQMGNQGSANGHLRECAAMMRAGILGEVKEVIIWSHMPIWPQGGTRGEEIPVPEHVNWDCWVGRAPMRPYANGYEPFAWRGWWDFGTGCLGDQGCHIWNLPFAGLDMRNPLWFQATTSGHNYDSLPKWSIIHAEFAATDWRPGFKFTWMDGGKRPDPNILDGDVLAPSGCLVIGDRGKMYAETPYGSFKKYYGISDDEVNAFRDKIEYPRSPGHFQEFVQGIRNNDPSRCWSNFPDYAGPLTEAVLAGNLAVWGASEPEKQGPRVEWDAKTMTITNNPEDKARMEALVTPTFREGYEKF